MSEEIKTQLDRIERCLTGDDELDQPGLVSRVKDHHRRITKLELWVYRVVTGGAAVSFVIGLIYKAVTDWWPHK